MNDDEDGRSRIVPVAFAWPAGFAFAGLWLLVFAFHGLTGLYEAVREGGVFTLVLLPLTLLVALGASVAAGLGAPRAMLVASSLVPWLVGAAAGAWGFMRLNEALGSVDMADKRTILAEGCGEALSGRVLGAALAGALFFGSSVALALRARRDGKKALVGAGLCFMGFGLALASSFEAASLRSALKALAFAASIDRRMLAAAAASEVTASTALGLGLAALGAALALIAFVVDKARARQAVGAALCAVIAPLGFALDVGLLRAQTNEATALDAPPWRALRDFQPAVVDSSEKPDRTPTLALTPAGVVDLAPAPQTIPPIPTIPAIASSAQPLALLVDERAGADAMAAAFAAAERAHADRIAFVGRAPELEHPLAINQPLLAHLVDDEVRQTTISLACDQRMKPAHIGGASWQLADHDVAIPTSANPGAAPPIDGDGLCVARAGFSAHELLAALANLHAARAGDVAFGTVPPANVFGLDGFGALGDAGIAGIGSVGVAGVAGVAGVGVAGLGTGAHVGAGSSEADRAAIERVLERHRPEVRFCYEHALQKNPALAGKLVARIVIDKDGSVTRATTDPLSAGAPDVGDDVRACVVARIRTWTFAPPTGGGRIDVTFPFSFQS
ncbi:MAG TPA: AgmX/PglI C-terminal domain-containing protein [Myxococcota bacterium]